MDIITQNQLTVTEQVNTYLVHISNELQTSSVKLYSKHLNQFKNWWISQEVITTPKDMLISFKGYLRSKYSSASSINSVLSAVRNLYKWLHEQGIIPDNPASSISNIKQSTGLKKEALTKSQIAKIYKHLDTTTSSTAARDRVLFTLLVFNGIRVNEAANIRVEDIGLNQGKRVIYLLRKGYMDKTNYIVLRTDVYDLISTFLDGRTTGYLFQSDKTGDKLHTDSISRIIKGLFKAVGLDSKRLSAHSLRHTYSILCLEAGTDVVALSHSLNHKSISTTMEYLKSYDKLSNNPSSNIDLGIGA